jgi:hypothetical protein
MVPGELFQLTWLLYHLFIYAYQVRAYKIVGGEGREKENGRGGEGRGERKRERRRGREGGRDRREERGGERGERKRKEERKLMYSYPP